MKLLILTAIVAAVASTPLTESKNWPWQVGKEYVYNVNSYTWTKFENSNSNGNAFKTQFIIHVHKPGLLLAKLVNPLFAQIQGQVIDLNTYPSDLKYEPVQKLDGVFEIIVDGGRVLSVKVPAYISVANENLLKALISALQVDLSAYGHINNFPNNFDKETFQGLFKKTEADITGDCETLYSVSPVSTEVRRELSAFAEDLIEITKNRNYGSCKKRVGFSFGVPESVVWNKITYDNEEKQFIKHTSESRMLAGKQGTIYKSETLSFVSVNPLLFGKQKAEVYSSVRFVLAEVKPEANTEWKKLEVNLMRESDSLLLLNSEASFFQVNAENIVNAKKLLQEITLLLQDLSKLSNADFLSKFNLLVRFIMLMDADQLTQMTSSIEVAKISKNISKNKMWVIYRNAVAQAGTIAAFEEVKAWILSKKVQGEEAAELIAFVAGSLGFYTEKVMTEFFELAFNPAVVEQKFLNTSTLLAATRFIRSSKQELFVFETVIPRLSLELKKAVEEGDGSKAQVYVRSLGNLARPEILKVFAPYLEGRIVVNNYFRTQIVISLEALAKLKNEDVRAVLFSILKNTAEPYEVRVAAALNIFLAVPTPEMMQVMAHMTNNDPSTQVRGVLASSIDSAANLKDPRFAELAKVAQSVSSMVNKEKYGYYKAPDSIIDEYIGKDDLTDFMESSFIGSENSFLPKYFRQALSEEDWISLSISDVKQLINYIKQVVYTRPIKSDAHFKFSAKKIIEELQIKREPRKPLEGAIFIDSLSQQQLFTFTEKELVAFISEVTENVQQLLSGHESQFTKVEINKKVMVTFPLAAGAPFVFAYTEPTVFIIQGKANNNLNADKVGTLNTEISIIYARNLEGSVGFYDTFTESYASSGVINKFQIYVPAKINAKVMVGDLKITFLLPEQKVQLVQFSVSPYTTVQKIRSPLTVPEDPATNLIKHADMIALPPANLGYIVGIDVYMTGYTYSSDINTRARVLSNIPYVLYQNDVACTGFEIVYVPKDTMNKEVTLTSFIDTLYNQNESGELGPATIISDVTPNSVVRRKELIKRVASGIKSAKVQVFDGSFVFDGQLKNELVLTAAFAESVVDNKIQAALFIKGSFFNQANVAFKMITPKIVPLNFEEALKNEIKVTYEADIKLGDSENILIKGYGERSKEHTNQLKNDPRGKKCLQETSQNNFYQIDCHKMIIKAHAPDFFTATLTYRKDNTSPYYINDFKPTNSYNLYKYFIIDKNQNLTLDNVGTLEMKVELLQHDNFIYYEVDSRYGNVLMGEGELYYYPYEMTFYTPITDWKTYYNWYTGYQYTPYCVVDSSKISTFSGRSYDYSLTSSWHAVMVDEINEFDKLIDLTILARRPSDNQAEVYISYKSDTGKYVEIYIKPTAIEVSTNTEKITEGKHTIYMDDVTKTPLLEYYTIADGVQVFLINNEAIRVVYDSHRLVIFTAEHLGTTRGICGQSSSEISDDYKTPFGLVDLPELYGASFSLDGEFSDPKTVELKKEAKLKAYQPVTKYTNILRSDAEWSKAENESVKGL